MKFVFNYPETSGLESDLLDSGEISDVAVAVEAAGFDALRAHRAPDPRRQLAGARRPPDPRPVRRPRVRGGGHRAHQAADPPVGRAVPQPVPARQDRGHPRPLLAGTVRPRARRRATTRPSSSPSASTSTNATRCSTRRSRSCPKAWSGEPFDADGLHFTAKGVIQRPRPAQDPIPIWIGGNSKLSRRRAAHRAGLDADGHPRGGRPHHALAAHRGSRAAGRDDRRGQGHGRRPCR